MAGKPGRSGGKRRGAGRKNMFPAKKDDYLIFERETIGGNFQQRELWKVLSVSADLIEFQYGDDIISVRHPEPGEIVLREGNDDQV